MRRSAAELAQEQTEAADGEADTYQTESSTEPSEERSLSGQVDARILFYGFIHSRIVPALAHLSGFELPALRRRETPAAHSHWFGNGIGIDRQCDSGEETGRIRFCLYSAESQHPRRAMLVIEDKIFVLRGEMDIPMFGVRL